MAKSYTMHDLPKSERPRERLQKVGVDNLSLQELLALVIEKGTKDLNVMSVAQNLLSHFGNLKNIKEASLNELKEVDGIGFATASKIKAALKLGEKEIGEYREPGEKIKTTEDVYNLLKNDFRDRKREHFKIISLDSRNKLINVDNVSVGTVDASLAHPREIFRPAIKNSAVNIILSHNHPSGDPKPSQSDIKITKDMKEAGKLIGIRVLDHIIITNNQTFSFRDKNYI